MATIRPPILASINVYGQFDTLRITEELMELRQVYFHPDNLIETVRSRKSNHQTFIIAVRGVRYWLMLHVTNSMG